VFTANKTVKVSLTPIPKYYITFLVANHGIPMDGVSVDLEGQIQTTNSYGYTSFIDLLASSYTYSVNVDGFVPVEEIVNLTDSTTVEVNLVLTPQFSLTLVAEPLNSGILTGAGGYEEGAVVNILAEPSAGYNFVNWTGEPDDIALLNNPAAANTSFIMPARGIILTANFEPIDYTFSTLINPESFGSVTVSPIKDVYNVGDSITVTASPVEDYEFDNWTEGVTPVSADKIYKFAMPPHNLVLTANFKIKEYTLTTAVSPAGSGTVTKDPLKDFYNLGNTINLSATPTTGYRFLKWTEAGVSASTNAQYALVMPARNVSLTANFEVIPKRTLTIVVDPVGAGTVTGAGTYLEVQQITV